MVDLDSERHLRLLPRSSVLASVPASIVDSVDSRLGRRLLRSSVSASVPASSSLSGFNEGGLYEGGGGGGGGLGGDGGGGAIWWATAFVFARPLARPFDLTPHKLSISLTRPRLSFPRLAIG